MYTIISVKETLFRTERKIGRILGFASRPFRPIAVGSFWLIVSVSNLSERLSILLTPFTMEFGIAALDERGPIWVSRTLINGGRMRLEISEKTQRGIYFMKVYERELARFFVSNLKEGDVCIDIGANVGYFTVLAAQAVGVQGRVIACEPEEENFELLKKMLL